MAQPKKVEFVQNLAVKLKKAKSLVLADHSGLTVPQQEALRKKIKTAGGEFTVVKNSLLKLALEKAELKTPNLKLLGPTALMIALADELAAIKVLVQFSEEFTVPQIKAAIFENQLLTKEMVFDLAKIPSRNELIIQLASLLRFPLLRFIQDLSIDMRKLVFIFSLKGGENHG